MSVAGRQVMADYRRALRHGDIDAAVGAIEPSRVKETLRDELARQHRFWRDATVRQEHERAVTDDVLEIYEHVRHPCSARLFRVVSLLRRQADGGWRLVETRDTPDEQIVAHVPCMDSILRADALRLDEPVDLTVQGPHRGSVLWLDGCLAGLSIAPAREVLRGPLERIAIASKAPRVLTLRMMLVGDRAERCHLLARFALAISTLVEERGPWVHIAPTDRVLHRAQVRDQARAAAGGDADALTGFHVRYQTRAGIACTRGLCLFGLPEVEMSLVHVRRTPGALREMARGMLALGDAPPLGAVVELLGMRFRVRRGRRGPAPGDTYGRWGAIRLSRLDSERPPPA